jgi:hypothetical protein
MLGGSFVAIHESINYMYSVIYYKLIQRMWAQCVLAVLFCSSREMKMFFFFSRSSSYTTAHEHSLYINNCKYHECAVKRFSQDHRRDRRD